MSHWWCCCDRDCTIFADDFDRGSTTTVAGWIELAGDSEIVSDELQVPANGLILADTAHPVNSRTGHVYVDLVDLQNGKYWQVRIGCDYTGSNGDTVEVQCLAGDISLGLNGATPSVFRSFTPGETVRLFVCRGIDSLWAYIDISRKIYACVDDDSLAVPRYAALANWGDTNAVLFDNFRYGEHEHTNDDCAACYCDCLNYCVPKTLTLTITATEDCTCLDGVEVELVHDDFAGGVMRWIKTIVMNKPGCDGYSTWEFTLTCMSDGVYTLCIEEPAPWIGGGGWVACNTLGVGPASGWAAYPTTTSCKPLELVFPTLRVTYSGPPGYACTIQPTVTE